MYLQLSDVVFIKSDLGVSHYYPNPPVRNPVKKADAATWLGKNFGVIYVTHNLPRITFGGFFLSDSERLANFGLSSPPLGRIFINMAVAFYDRR